MRCTARALLPFHFTSSLCSSWLLSSAKQRVKNTVNSRGLFVFHLHLCASARAPVQ
ncbi:hypothetical protein Droror1_Dr00028246, partial [Drosera rotundifolia]